MKPMALVLAYFLAGLQFNDIARLLAHIPSHILIVVDLSEKTDTLRILTAGIDKMLTFSNLSHLLFHIVADREEGLAQLPIVDLSQEVGLVFHGIGRGTEPFVVAIPLSLCVMAGGNEVVVVAHFLVEGTKLDKPVAHHIRVGRESGLHLLHGVARHLAPVFLVAVHHLQLAAKAMGYSGGHLHVFLRRTVPRLFLLGPYHDIETIGMQSLACQLVDHHAAVYAAREQHGYSFIVEFFHFV